MSHDDEGPLTDPLSFGESLTIPLASDSIIELTVTNFVEEMFSEDSGDDAAIETLAAWLANQLTEEQLAVFIRELQVNFAPEVSDNDDMGVSR